MTFKYSMMKKLSAIFFLFASLIVTAQKPPCEVTYQYSTNEYNQITEFINKVELYKIINWHWDFGDGTYSSIANPKHVYMEPGTYIACLTITTEDGCENTFCDTIIINSSLLDTNSYHSISGKVFAGSSIILNGVALLILKQSLHYRVISYSLLNDGIYEFSSLGPGEYLVYAIPDFNLNVNYFPSYLPSYYGNTPFWQDADIILLNSSLTNQNIHLFSNQDILYGPDTISGSVNISDQNSFEYAIYYANWFGNNPQNNIDFTKAPNFPVLLMNNYSEPIRYAVTDEKGNFRFVNLPVKIYKLACEKAGFVSAPALADMTATSGTFNCTFFIDSEDIYFGIEDNPINSLSVTNVFPNPVTDNLFITVSSLRSNSVKFHVTDISGKSVILPETFNIATSGRFIVPFGTFPAGIYFLSVSDNNNVSKYYRIIKL